MTEQQYFLVCLNNFSCDYSNDILHVVRYKKYKKYIKSKKCLESVHIWCAIESEKIIWLVSYRLLKRPIKECIFAKSVMRVYLWNRSKSIMSGHLKRFGILYVVLFGWKMNPNMVNNIQSIVVQLIVKRLRVIRFFLCPGCMIRMKWPHGKS